MQGLHIISTNKQSPATLVHIMDEIHPYIDFVHLREKSWTDGVMKETVNKLFARGVPQHKIILNNRIAVAKEMNVRGVHLPYKSKTTPHHINYSSTLLTGYSVHSLEEAKQAEQKGGDYLMYGHIFPSNSKKGIPPRGLRELQEVIQYTRTPILGIGGITVENTQDVLATGAKGIAVLSGVLLAHNPLQEVKRYRSEIAKQTG